MKKGRRLVIFLLVVFCTLVNVSGFDSTGWTDYLGNPQRTAYSMGKGPESPEIFWKVIIPGDFDTPPFIIDDKVFILCKNDMYHISTTTVVVIDLVTGEVLQKFRPLIPEERLIFEIFPLNNEIMGMSFEGIYEIDLNSEKGTLVTEIPQMYYGTPSRYPVVLEDTIIFPTDPPVCLSRSSMDTVWNAGDILPDPDLHVYNLVGDETIVVFIVGKDGITQLLAADPSTGMIKWMSDPILLSLWLALGEDAVYYGGTDLGAFDKEGSELWHFVPDQQIASNIVLGPDAVYVADYSNTVYKIDLDGTLVWKTEWEASPWYYETHLLGVGDILYCIGNSGGPDSATGCHITALSMEDGSHLWNQEFESIYYIRAAPAFTDGILVVGRMRGIVMAFASDPDLFVKQGNAFHSKGLESEAISSYEKALQFYQERGDSTKSQEIQELILELKNFDETAPPESERPSISPPETTLPKSTTTLILVVASLVLMGVFIAYYFIRRKP